MMIDRKHTFRVNDVYQFRYNAEMVEKLVYPYHCFDGTLTVRATDNGKLILVDGYWSSDNRTFTIDEAFEQGTLEFLCNLDDVVETSDSSNKYYDDDDLITVCHHAGYRNKYYLKKGAEKSISKMLSVLGNQIDYERHLIESSKRNIEMIKKKIERLESGDTDIYI